jgi:hypothetical protein
MEVNLHGFLTVVVPVVESLASLAIHFNNIRKPSV